MKKSDIEALPATDQVNLLLLENAAQEKIIASQRRTLRLWGCVSVVLAVAFGLSTWTLAHLSPVSAVFIAADAR